MACRPRARSVGPAIAARPAPYSSSGKGVSFGLYGTEMPPPKLMKARSGNAAERSSSTRAEASRGAQVLVGDIRAGEPDLAGLETGVTGQEDLAGRDRVRAEPGTVDEAKNGQSRIGLHGVERPEGERAEGPAQVLDLPPDHRRVID